MCRNKKLHQLNFRTLRVKFVADRAQKTSLTKLVTIPPIKSTSQIPPLARWITVSRNLKEEAKDEPASGVGYEVIDLFAQKYIVVCRIG